MPIWRMQCAIGADSPDIRDRFVITPHFNDMGVNTDPQGLCQDLAQALATKFDIETSAREVRVTAYDAQGTQPVFPQGNAVVNAGAFPASTCPRELALCLSYYAGQNRPRYRGRLYIPAAPQSMTPGVRPSQLDRDRLGGFATIFSDLGGADVDWSVYSRVDDTARAVTNWWVDDEWDVIRSRGLRPTARSAGTVDEEN